MSNVPKHLLDEKYDPITVYSFAGSVIIPTEQGSYWANAVGGMVEARPTGNPFVLFALKYIWGLTGDVSEFPQPIKIKLNTGLAVTETFDFKFPAPEVDKVGAEDQGSGDGGTDEEGGPDEAGGPDEEGGDGDEEGGENEGLDELDEGGEGDDDKAEDDDELDRLLAEESRAEGELSW